MSPTTPPERTRLSVSGWTLADIPPGTWRQRMRLVDDETQPLEARMRAARRMIRDGPDVCCLVLMDLWQTEQPGTRWSRDNCWEPLVPALRMRATKILSQPARRPRGEGHRQALSFLASNPRRRDVHLFLRFAEHPELQLRASALQGLAATGPYLDEGLRAQVLSWAEGALGQQPGEHHEGRLAWVLGKIEHPAATALLERGWTTLGVDRGGLHHLRQLLLRQHERWEPVAIQQLVQLEPLRSDPERAHRYWDLRGWIQDARLLLQLDQEDPEEE